MSTEGEYLKWQNFGCESSGCIEVAETKGGDVLLRDSKDPDGPVLHFSRQEWDAFAAGIRAGDLDQAPQS